MNQLPKALFFWPAVGAVLFAFLQTGNVFHYYLMEQNQLFQNTWPYVAGHLLQPGGLALTLSEFLTQFFLLPCAGAGITAFLLAGAGWLAHGIVRQIAPHSHLMIACLLPVVALLFVHFDFNYPAFGTVAFLIAEAAFLLVSRIKNPTLRSVGHLLATPLLFCLAGPVFLLYAVMVVVSSATTGKKGRLLLWAGTGGEVILTGILSVYFAYCGEYRHVFLPDGYYHLSLIPRKVIYFSWCALLFLLAWACILRCKPQQKSRRRRWLGIAIQALCIAALCRWGVPEYADRNSYLLKELDYYCRTEQWDLIQKRCEGTLTNYLYIAYANLALLHTGELGNRIFAYDQRGPQGLWPDWNATPAVSVLLNDIYFALNATALSQEMAFEAYVCTAGDGNPRVLKRLVQTNLIYGAWPVAEKYLSILEHTLCYRQWAGEQRRFLYNDAEVENDPLLGNKRRALMPNASFSLKDGFDAELQGIAAANPADRSAITYVGAFYLLEKNLEGFRMLIEKHFATPILPSLPLAFQEAIIILSEQDPDYRMRFGISDAVIERFAMYRRQVLEGNRSGNQNALPALLKRSYGDTYWYYFMFK